MKVFLGKDKWGLHKLLFISLFAIQFTACNQMNNEIKMQNDCSQIHSNLSENKIMDKDLIEMVPSQLPKITLDNIELNDEQKKLTINALNTVISVVAGRQPMAENDPILGQGEYHYPKDPNKPILGFNYDGTTRKFKNASVTSAFQVDGSYPFQNLAINFSRQTENSPWCFGSVYFIPPFALESQSNYHTALNESSFTNNLNLQFLTVKLNKIHKNTYFPDTADIDFKYPDLKSYAEYRYKLRDTLDVFVSFYVHFADYNSKEKFPKNFNSMVVRRGAEKVSLNSSEQKTTVKVGETCPKTGFWTCPKLERESTLYMRQGDIMPGTSYKIHGYDIDNMYWAFVKGSAE